MYHVNVNINSTVENVTQVKGGATINAGVTIERRQNIICAKKIILGIFLHVVVRMVNIQEVYLLYSVVKSFDEETKTFQTNTVPLKSTSINFNKKKVTGKTKMTRN